VPVPAAAALLAGAALLAAGAALLAAGAALLAAGAALELDSLDELLPPQAARASEATPSTAADLRTVVRFMQSP
jgi:predicted phage tail protein